MPPHRSLALGCFQWAELSSVPERLLSRVCLGSWQHEGAELSSSGSCERGDEGRGGHPPGRQRSALCLVRSLGRWGAGISHRGAAAGRR